MSLPPCPVHSTDFITVIHAPVLCHTEHVWHPVVCKPQPREKATVSRGTHLGKITDAELKARRRAKNARNASRAGDERAPGGAKRVGGRLHRLGNRQRRGVGA